MRHVRIDPSEGPADDDSRWPPGIHVRDRMSRPAITVPAQAPLVEALRLMAVHRIHYLPVLDEDGRLVGLVNEDDVLGIRRARAPAGVDTVASVMSFPVVSVGPDSPLRDALRIMADHGVGALPVVAAEQVLGILTQSDIVAALAHQERL